MKGRRGEGRAPVNEKLVEMATRIESGALTADPSSVALLLSLLQT
jgi:hypothetical protein